VLDPALPNRLYAGTVRVYRSTNGAQKWTAMSPNFIGGNGKITAIGVAPSTRQTLYAASVYRDGLATDLQRTTNNGTTWVSRVSGLPLAIVSDIVVSPSSPMTAYVSVGGFGHGHIFHTTNGGDTWTDISANIPDLAVNGLAADFRTNPPTLFAANDVGVFASDNGGATWQRFGTGLPKVIVSDLYLDPQTHILVAGTYGRGVWSAYADGGPTSPGNDTFANASLIAGTDGIMYESNVAASEETGEPKHAGQTGGRSIWYRWTAPVSGAVTMSTSPSSFDTAIAVYEGSAVESLSLVAANNNISGSNKASRVQFAAVKRRTYSIAIDGVNAASGPLTFYWYAPPPNDLVQNAQVVTGNKGSVIASNIYASAVNGEPSPPDASPSKQTLWYQWTAPAGGTVKLDTSNSYSLFSILGVYTRPTPETLQTVATKPRNTETLAVAVTAGTTYHFQLDTVESASGTLRFDWAL
jgi:hypothetical protein